MKVKLYHPDHWLEFPVFSCSLTILWRRLVPGKEYRGFLGVHFGHLRESRHFVLPQRLRYLYTKADNFFCG